MSGYDAFISYSHAADAELAPALERGLQRLARPWNRRRALSVFRDQSDLAVNPHLWGTIAAALDQTGWFVLLASPGSAGSVGVGKEIEHWLERPDATDRILLVVTEGVCAWSEAGGFTPETNAVHPALRDAFAEEPLFLDLTWARESERLDLADPRFRDTVASLAAPIHGIPKDDLVGEDIRQFKLSRRLRRAAIAGLTVLTIAAVIASIVAVTQQHRAEENAARSRARELVVTARSTMDDDPALAALEALEANYPNGATSRIDLPDARAALGAALRNLQWAATTHTDARIDAPATHFVYADDRRLATIDANRCVCDPRWWDATTGRPVRAPASPSARDLLAGYERFTTGADAVTTSPRNLGATPVTDPFTIDATRGLLVGWSPTTHALLVQPTAGGAVTGRLELPAGVEPASVVVLPSGRVVAVTTAGQLEQWSIATGGAAQRLAYDLPAGNTVRSVAAVGDDRILVDSADSGPTAPPLAPCSVQCVDDATVASDVTFGYVGTTITDPLLDVVDLAGPRPTVVRTVGSPAVTVPGSYVVAPTAPGGHRYAAARSIATDTFGDAAILVWDIATGRAVARIPRLTPTDLRWLDGSTLAVASGAWCRGAPPQRPADADDAGRRPRPGERCVRPRDPPRHARCVAGARRATPRRHGGRGRRSRRPAARRAAGPPRRQRRRSPHRRGVRPHRGWLRGPVHPVPGAPLGADPAPW